MGSRDSWMDMAARSPWPVGIVVGVVMCALFSWIIPSMMAASDNPYLGPLGRTLREHQFGEALRARLVGAVQRGIALAEHVQVDAVQDEDFHGFSRFLCH